MRRQEVVDRLSGNKVSKETANYRVGKGSDICFECEHYLITGAPSSNCRRVLGPVEAQDTCDLFTPVQTQPQARANMVQPPDRKT